MIFEPSPLAPLVWIVIFTQRHQADFLGNLSGKTKQISIKFLLKFVSFIN